MTCTKKTTLLTLSLATFWSMNALALPPNNGPQPPPEAYTACEGKHPGEKARFTGPRGNTVSGTCEQQGDGRLLLRPDHPGMGNRIPPAAYQDCIGKRLGDSVQIVTPNGRTITGTCQSDGDRLYMRPNPPGSNTPSMGGTSTLFTCLAFGAILSVSRNNMEENELAEETDKE